MTKENDKVVELNPMQEPDEVIEDTVYFSGEYLSSACFIVSTQIVHAKEEDRPKTREELHAKCTELMRNHVPLAYGFFWQESGGKNVLPTGTIDVILSYIWSTQGFERYLGGKNHGIILPGQN